MVINMVVIASVVLAVVVVVRVALSLQARQRSTRRLSSPKHAGAKQPFGALNIDLLPDGPAQAPAAAPRPDPATLRGFVGERQQPGTRHPWHPSALEALLGSGELVDLSSMPRSKEISARISSFYTGEEDSPYPFTGDGLLELVINKDHVLYLGLGYMSVGNDPDEELTHELHAFYPEPARKGLGELGCAHPEDAHAWLQALCEAAGLSTPRYRDVSHIPPHEVCVHDLGVVQEEGRAWRLLGYQATDGAYANSDCIMLKLAMDAPEARVFLVGPRFRYARTCLRFGELLLRLDLKEYCSRKNDPDVIAEPLVSSAELLVEGEGTVRIVRGKALAVVWEVDDEEDGVWGDVVLREWPSLAQAPTEHMLMQEHVYDASIAQEGDFAVIFSHQNREIHLIQLSTRARTSFPCPREMKLGASVQLSPLGGEVALVMEDSGESWVQVHDAIGNVRACSERVQAGLELASWGAHGISVMMLTAGTLEETLEDPEVDKTQCFWLWDPVASSQSFQPMHELGAMSPDGKLTCKRDDFGFAFYEGSERLSRRTWRDSWEMDQELMDEYVPVQWLSEEHVVVTLTPGEVVNVRTGAVVELLGEELAEATYHTQVSADGFALLFGTWGDEELNKWARFELPAAMETAGELS